MILELTLETLEIYQLAKRLSQVVWKIYNLLTSEIKRITGYQFIESTDSVGANIAEGYGRYHFLDRIKFLYNARGSLLESKYWFDLLVSRKILTDLILIKEYDEIYNKLKPKLNNFINSIYKYKKSNSP